MTSLYHSGRQRDALAAFTRARTVFVEELGLDPPPALTELQRQILDRTLEQPAAQAPPVSAQDDPPDVDEVRLPDLPSSLIGRDGEIERIEQLLDSGTRLVTVVGLGGIGKTTVALAVGHRLAGAGRAVAFVDLAATTRAATALQRMCEAASIQAGADAAADLAHADPELVLIADNVEQVDDIAVAVARLIASTHRLTMLVTSRTALHVRAEHVVTIAPLPTSSSSGAASAGQLFAARARQLRDELEVSGTDAAVVEICELAGGIPLAIEIAARRLGRLSPDSLLDRLRRQRALLLDGSAAIDVPDRQQSLRTVLDATAALLSPGAVALARRLCVVNGPITVGTLERIYADHQDHLFDHLDELIDANLVNGPDSDDRVRMPVPVAEYVAENSDAVDDDRRRVLEAMLSIAEALKSTVGANGRWREGELIDDAAAVAVACDTAVAVGDVESGVRLALALRRYWLLAGRFAEAIQCCGDMLALTDDERWRVHLQLVRGQFMAALNRSDAGDVLADAIERANDVYEVDDHLLANSWCYLGSWSFDHGDHDGARRAAVAVEALAARSDDRALVELCRDFAGYVAFRTGDFDTAVRLGTEALAEARKSGDRFLVIDLLVRTAENLLETDRLDEADGLLGEAMEIALTTPIGPLGAKVLLCRAAVDIELGRLSAGIGSALEALRMTATSYPDPVTQACALRMLAAAWWTAGDVDAASRCVGAAKGLLGRAGAAPETAWVGPIDRRLQALRNDAQADVRARVAELDPDPVVASLIESGAAG
jgi:predicted ATPase